VIIKTSLIAAALMLAAQPVLAQNKKVYRCEEASGRVTYSDEACKGGVALNNDDARSDDQRKAAADAVKREEKLGDKLARDRRLAEKSAPKSGAALIPYSAAEKAAKEQPSSKKTTTTKKKTRVKEKTQASAALSCVNRRYFAHNESLASMCSGFTGMQATGQTCTHCGSSKWPTHSVHLPGSMT
jgi:Domain of unknown function (DUF4124)